MALGRARQPQPVATRDIVDYERDQLTLGAMRQVGAQRSMDLYEQSLHIEDEDRARADSDKFEALFEKHQGDVNAAWPEMMAINPGMAFQIRDQEQQSRMQMGAELSQHLENEQARRTQSTQIVDQLDEASWGQGRQSLSQVDPDLAASMPEAYDPAWVDQIAGMSQTEAEADEARMQGLKEVVAGEVQRGTLRMFSRASTPEEWADQWKVAEQLGIPGGVLAQIPREFPGEAHVAKLREDAMDPRDAAALERAQLQQDYQQEYLAYQRENLAFQRERFLQGDDGALQNIFGTGAAGKSALWRLGLQRLGREYPDGDIPDAELDALFDTVADTSRSGTATEDRTAQRAGDKIVAEWLAENPRPPADAGPEEMREWEDEFRGISTAGDVAAGRTGYADAASPYVGERSTTYASMPTQVRQRIEGILREAREPITPANVEQFLRDNPTVAEGLSGADSAPWSGGSR